MGIIGGIVLISFGLYSVFSKLKELDKTTPIIGFGLIFPEFENEETYEYAARPLELQFEENLQDDDDLSDEE